jgi:hypothetical protein
MKIIRDHIRMKWKSWVDVPVTILSVRTFVIYFEQKKRSIVRSFEFCSLIFTFIVSQDEHIRVLDTVKFKIICTINYEKLIAFCCIIRALIVPRLIQCKQFLSLTAYKLLNLTFILYSHRCVAYYCTATRRCVLCSTAHISASSRLFWICYISYPFTAVLASLFFVDFSLLPGSHWRSTNWYLCFYIYDSLKHDIPKRT